MYEQQTYFLLCTRELARFSAQVYRDVNSQSWEVNTDTEKNYGMVDVGRARARCLGRVLLAIQRERLAPSRGKSKKECAPPWETRAAHLHSAQKHGRGVHARPAPQHKPQNPGLHIPGQARGTFNRNGNHMQRTCAFAIFRSLRT